MNSRAVMSSKAKRSISAAEPYSSVSPHFPAETALRTSQGPTITSHASTNANPWMRTARHRAGENQMSLIAVSPIATGASTTNDGRVRHSSPNSNPTSTILATLGAFKASTSASAAML